MREIGRNNSYQEAIGLLLIYDATLSLFFFLSLVADARVHRDGIDLISVSMSVVADLRPCRCYRARETSEQSID